MKFTKIMMTTLMALGVTSVAQANGGSGIINFSGSIVDAPCSIHPDSQKQTVDLGAVSNVALANGGTSVPRPFNIQLEQCDFTNGKNKVTTTFSGVLSSVATDNDLFSISGDASGAGVGIETFDGEKVKLGVATSAKTLAGTNPVLQYQAYLKGAADTKVTPIQPGQFSAVANFELNYN